MVIIYCFVHPLGRTSHRFNICRHCYHHPFCPLTQSPSSPFLPLPLPLLRPQEDNRVSESSWAGVQQTPLTEVSEEALVAALTITSADQQHAGNYTCAPAALTPVSATLHVLLNGRWACEWARASGSVGIWGRMCVCQLTHTETYTRKRVFVCTCMCACMCLYVCVGVWLVYICLIMPMSMTVLFPHAPMPYISSCK